MKCKNCNTEMEEQNIIGIDKIITVYWLCPNCGLEVDE